MTPAFLLQDTGTIYGAQRATLDVITGLLRAGRVNPRVWLLEETRLRLDRSDFREALRTSGAEITMFPVAGAFSRACVRALREALRVQGILLLHSVGPKADLFSCLAARGSPVRHVSTVHGWLFREDWKERLHEAVNRFCLRRCDRVICLSTHYESLLLGHGVRRDRLVRIPSGFDPAGLDGIFPGAPREYAAGWMGRLSEEKDIGTFLDAVALTPAGRFLVAGDGPLRPWVESRLREPALSGRVTLAGYLPRADFFRSVGALVMTSRIENLPYTILEAMACRLPVISTRVGGIPDLVEDGVTGLLTPPSDARALADALARVLPDPVLARRLGESGRDRLEREFSPARAIADHERLYAELHGTR
jgi:glycosyltransferase involved in cell wall biosynthesis